jgi:hypothetical protein
LVLKPDAFVRVGVGAYEDRWFIEVDLGTESRGVIAGKLRTYRDYYLNGSEQADSGVFPRVLWLTDTAAREDVLKCEVERLPEDAREVFSVGQLVDAVAVLGDQLDDAAHAEAGVGVGGRR